MIKRNMKQIFMYCLVAMLFSGFAQVGNLSGNSAVFLRGRNAYFFDASQSKIRLIGNANKIGQLAGFSPDCKRIAFVRKNQAIGSSEIGIYSIKSQTTKYVPLNDLSLTQLMELTWFSNNRILCVGHVNPSANAYVLYDTNTGKVVNSCTGIYYQVLADEKSMLYAVNPHWTSDQLANITLVKDSKNSIELYRVKSKEDEIYDAKISKDLKKIAFWTFEKRQNKAYICIGDYNHKVDHITKLKKYEIDADANVNANCSLQFSPDNQLLAMSKVNVFGLKGSRYQKIGTQKIDNKEFGPVIPKEESVEKLEAVIRQYFKIGKSNDVDTDSVVWLKTEN